MKTTNTMKSLVRAMSVLKSFTLSELELGGADIVQKVGIPKTTAYRILAYLTEGGLLEKNPMTGKYMIGPTLYSLGSLYLSTTGILKATEPVIKTLNNLTNEAVNVGILDKRYMAVIMKEESRDAFRFSLHIGSVIPAYTSAMGKALLSELTEAEIDNLFPEERLRQLTKKTIATKSELKRELEQIRKTGVSFDREGSTEGVDGIASVIRDVSGKAVAAMSITPPSFRINEGKRERFANLVKLGASLASYWLGYQDTANPVRDIEEIRSWWEQNQTDSALKEMA